MSAMSARALALLEPRHAPPAETLNAGGAVDVTVRAHVMSLSGIDSKEQRFDALVWLQLEWLTRLPPDHPDATRWRPELSVLNMRTGSVSGDPGAKAPSFRAVADDESGGTRCFLAYTLHGQFDHTFNLRSFPFDVQTLAVRGVFWRSPLERAHPAEGESACVPFRGRLAFHFDGHLLYREGFVQKDVWVAHEDSAVTVRAGHTDERHRSTRDGQRFSTLTVEVTLKRRHQFYLLNVVLPFDLFVCLSFISFAVEIPDGLLSDRSTITLNQVLTAAAFKVVVSGYTPALGYLHLLDAYILLCFIFMAAVAACNVAVSMAPDAESARALNRRAGMGLAIAWGAVHAVLPLAQRLSHAAHAADVAARDASEAANARRWRAGLLGGRTLHGTRRLQPAEFQEDGEGDADALCPASASAAEPRRPSRDGLHSRSRAAAPDSP